MLTFMVTLSSLLCKLQAPQINDPRHLTSEQWLRPRYYSSCYVDAANNRDNGPLAGIHVYVLIAVR